MNPTTRISVTDISSDGRISVLVQTYAVYNTQEVILSNHREMLAPSQFDRAKEILPDNLYNALLALWTPEVVAAWEEKQKHLAEQKV